MSFTEDITEFFNIDEFGDVVTVVTTTLTFNAIFDNPSAQHELRPEARQAFSPARADVDGPQLLMSEADAALHSIAPNLHLQVNGNSYRVAKRPEKDGTGLVTVFLIENTPGDTSGSWDA